MILKKNILFIFLICFVQNNINSQNIKLEGRVLDSLNKPLMYANVIGESKSSSGIIFSISDEKGKYSLKLKQNLEYTIKASFLGYESKTVKIKATKDTVYNFILNESNELLDVVKIDAKLAMSIKKDTITYQTDKFVTGEERKLRDVLKKLPGVEVDKEGNVMVQGKKITKLLVEDKQFFTGDSKLAVNNIPADVINEVEVIDNYTDISILKGLEDSGDMAMNIKLKKGKKKFWFGDVEVGSGVEERYLVHPSLFYYSPKSSLNIIGDFNNTGEKSFTFKDYLDFEGGYKKILLNPTAYFSRLNDDFSRFLTDRNFKSSIHAFGAFNINQTLNQTTDLIGYTIYSRSENETETQNVNEYINESNSQIENRAINSNPTNQFIIGKIGLEKKDQDGGKFKIQSYIKASDNVNRINTSTTSNNNIDFINTNVSANNIDFKQDVEWYKSLSENHTITSIGSFNYIISNGLTNWKTNNNIFQDAVPVIDDSFFSLFKDLENTSRNFSLFAKHYWTIGNFFHLHTTSGLKIYSDTFKSNEFQQLSNGTINNFSSSNFGNDIQFNFTNFYTGTHLKFQTGKLTFKPGIFFHSYTRSIDQLDATKRLDKKYILPELLIKYDISKSEQMNISYNRKVRFPSMLRLADNFTLTNFNSIYQGNSSLENELYNQVSIYYYRFNLFKKLNYNLRVSYRKTEEGIRNSTFLENINFITRPILLDNSDQNVSLSLRVSKGYDKVNLSLNGHFSKSKFQQIINNNIQKNKSDSYSLEAGFRTKFSQFPNVNIHYSKSFNNYQTPAVISRFENDILEFGLGHVLWKDFLLNIDYNYQRFNNNSMSNSNKNDILNLSILYSIENSPWSFEISANNIFNNRFIRNSSFTNFLISDSRTFVLPRISMFKLTYKL